MLRVTVYYYKKLLSEVAQLIHILELENAQNY